MSSGTSQQFCVRWNSHLGSLGAAFPQLLAGQRFVDVTLACEGHQLHCHRLVLAACSTYFESLLGENPCKHPIIILPRDIKLWEIQALVDFMYKGEVNVSQAGLSDLLKCAEILQIRGLCGSDAALNLNQVNTGNVQFGSTPTSVNFVNSVPSNPAAASTTSTTTTSPNNIEPSNSPNTLGSSLQEQSISFDQGESLAPTNTNSSKKCTDALLSSSPGQTNKMSTEGSENSLLLKSIKHERLKAVDSHHKDLRHRTSTPNRVIDKVEPVDISMDEDIDDDDLNHANEKSLDGEAYSTKYVDYLEGSKGANQHHLNQTQQQLQSENEGNLRATPHAATFPAISGTALTMSSITLDNYSNSNGNFHANASETDENHSFFNDEGGDVYIIKDIDDEIHEEICIVDQDNLKSTIIGTKHDSSSSSLSTRLNYAKTNDLNIENESGLMPRNSFGKIRVKSNENLFGNHEDNQKPKGQHKQHDTVVQKINRNRKFDADSGRSSTLFPAVRNSKRTLPGALRFNRNSMTVFLKPPKETPGLAYKNESGQPGEKTANEYESTQIKSEYDSVDNYESIVCLPNVMEMYNDNEEVEISVGENSGLHSLAQTEYDDIKVGNEMIYAQTINSPTGILRYAASEINSSDQEPSHHYNGLEICSTNGRPVEFAMAQFLSNHMLSDTDRNSDKKHDLIMAGRSTLPPNSTNRRCRYINSNRLNTKIPERPPTNMEPTLSAVVLRNPRSNQPRTYSNDALYAALMDVKAGESIYRASQIHKVPRKTLRNWMKRWHIKSAYPMPRQLKQAAEKKKRIQQQMETAVANNSNTTCTALDTTDLISFNNHCEKTGSHSQMVYQSSQRQSQTHCKNLNKK